MNSASDYAVIRTGGKQYMVSPGELVSVEKLTGDKGAAVIFDQVLVVGAGESGKSAITFGDPLVKGASVSATIVRQFRDKKVLIFKKRRRKGYTKKQGHRQNLTQVRIEAIKA